MPNELEAVLAKQEAALKARLAEQAKDGSLFPLEANDSYKELERISRAKGLVERYSFVRANRWFFLATALTALSIAVLSAIHPSAGEVALSAESGSIEFQTEADTSISSLADLFPDFRVAGVAGILVARDTKDAELIAAAGQSRTVTITPPARISRAVVPKGATFALHDCGASFCTLTLTGESMSLLLSVQAARICPAGDGQDQCSPHALDNNISIELAREASVNLVRAERRPGEKDDRLFPLLVAQGKVTRITFNRREGRNGLPTGRANTLSRGSLTFRDFGSDATVKVVHREMNVTGSKGTLELGLRGQTLETTFVGSVTDARTVGESKAGETLVPSALQWMSGNKTIALLVVALSAGVGFVLSVVRRATGKDKL